MKIAPDVHVVPGVTANPYLLIDHNGLTLIDTGIPGSAGMILGFIKRLGFTVRDLKHILLTHADYDHAGSAAALKKATGARVYASAFEAGAVATGSFPRSLKAGNFLVKLVFTLAERLGKISPVHVDERVSDGQVLPMLNGLRVVDTAGHTPGHISLFASLPGILFTGDSIVCERKRLVGSHDPVTWDRERSDASVRKQMALRPRIVCPGHGPVMMGGMDSLLSGDNFFPALASYQRL